MKIKLVLLFLFTAFSLPAFSQSLTISDFSKCRNGILFLKQKGFELVSDTTEGNQHRTVYSNKTTGEKISISSGKDKEGAEQFLVDYYVKTVAAYLQLETAAKSSKYKYNKQGRYYRDYTSSYSWTDLAFIGIDSFQDAYYYHIRYTDFTGKELSAPQISPADSVKTH